MIQISKDQIPSYKIEAAINNGVNQRILFVVGGGLGDRICAEPTLRYAIENFKNCKISLACRDPEIFSHLSFDKIYDLVLNFPIIGHHLVLETYPIGKIFNQFIDANLMSIVDYCSISALRMILPIQKRIPYIEPKIPVFKENFPPNEPKAVTLHLGKSWPSRTFPSKWWQEIIDLIIKRDFVPYLIGKDCVKVNTSGCIDLRDHLSLNDFLWICRCSSKLVTNDSSPLHVAAGCYNKIACVPTCRPPGYLPKREGIKYFSGINKMFEEYNSCPNTLEIEDITKIPNGNRIENYLPHPHEVVSWILSY